MTDNHTSPPSLFEDFYEARMSGKDSSAYSRVCAAADRAHLAALAHSTVANFLNPTDPSQTLGFATIRGILRERCDNMHYRRGMRLTVSSFWQFDKNTPVLSSVPADYDDAHASPIIAKLGLRAWVFCLADALVTVGLLVHVDNDYHIAGMKV